MGINFKNYQELITQHQLISRILKSNDRTVKYNFIDLEVDVGCEDEIFQYYDIDLHT